MQIVSISGADRSPSPDLKTKNRMPQTQAPNKVKRYLQSVKNTDRVAGSGLPEESRLRQEQQLRKRIYELEIENNQYRVIASECGALAERNKQLQEQMMLLLAELEEQRSQDSDEDRKTGNIESRYISQDHPSASSPQDRNQSNKTESTKRGRFMSLSPATPEVRALVEYEVEQALRSFEQKMKEYVIEVEKKLEEMKKYNLEVFVTKPRSEVLHIPGEKGLGSLRLETPKPRKDSEHSVINIDISGMLDSQHSFGRSQIPLKKAESTLDKRLPSSYSEVIKVKIAENLRGLREHLTFLLGQHSHVDQPQLKQYSEQLKQELLSIVHTFFPEEENLANRNKQLQIKIKQLEECVQALRTKKNEGKEQFSGEREDWSLGSRQFEETERRLVRVITIMKSFNEQYSQILKSSRAVSMGL